MTPAQAILAGAAIIAVAILLVGSFHPAVAQHTPFGQFQLEHHSNTAANAGVFRLDTTTGEVSYCFLSGVTGAGSDLVCSRAVR